jgi:hypothetical protein
MGSEEHCRRRSTLAGEAEETVAGDELAPGTEVNGVSSSRVLREEGKMGVWFPSSDDDGVVRKRVATASSSGSKRAEASGEETKRKSAPAWQLRRG